MKQSESITALAGALANIHQHITPVQKDRTNPHFKNNYATLDAIMESVRPLLAGEGLSIVQGGGSPVTNVDGNLVGISVETMLLHASGEYITSAIVLPLDKPSAQAVGSAITYGRRYGVAALLSLTTEEDDDGHVANANVQNGGAKASAWKQPDAPALTSYGPDTAYAAPAPAKGAAASGTDDVGASSVPTDTPDCPICHGKMWDDRLTKRNPKAPNFKCRDRSCSGVIWPPKDAKRAAAPVDSDPVPF